MELLTSDAITAAVSSVLTILGGLPFVRRAIKKAGSSIPQAAHIAAHVATHLLPEITKAVAASKKDGPKQDPDAPKETPSSDEKTDNVASEYLLLGTTATVLHAQTSKFDALSDPEKAALIGYVQAVTGASNNQIVDAVHKVEALAAEITHNELFQNARLFAKTLKELAPTKVQVDQTGNDVTEQPIPQAAE